MPLNPRTKLSFAAGIRVSTDRFCCKVFNPFYCCCRGKNKESVPVREPDEIGTYLGEGTTIYLQMMKAFTLITFLLTVLNIPILLVYYENSKLPILGDFHRFFSQFSLASIGESSQGCGYANLDVA